MRLPGVLSRKLAPLGVLVAFVLACALLTPAEINGDGLGYLRRLDGDALAPGHLGYLPLARALVALLAPPVGERALIELEPLLRWLSILFAAGSLWLFLGAARRLHDGRRALFATLLLGLSHGCFRSAREVEVYAAAFFCLVAALYALTRLRQTDGEARLEIATWATLAGLAGGAAILFHLTLVLAAPGTLVMIARFAPAGSRRRALLLGTLALGLTASIPLLLALDAVGARSLPEAWRWLRSADHGLPYRSSLLNPLTALWGLGRSLVHAPYPHEASALAVAALTALGGAVWTALIWLRSRAVSAPGAPPSVVRHLLACWLPPLALFGVLFYPSDTERWLFVLPVLSLWLAPAAGRAGAWLLAAIAIANLISFDLPGALAWSGREQAAAVDRLARPTDLIVSPGNGWDELLGFASRTPARRFILIYYVGAERGLERAVERMHREIERTRSAGGRVFVARLRDASDHRGFKELAWFGLGGEGFAALFARYHPRPGPIEGLWQLAPR